MDNDVFGFDPKNTGNKNKNRQMRLHQTKNHPHNKAMKSELTNWLDKFII
jgi:hypothetical protein